MEVLEYRITPRVAPAGAAASVAEAAYGAPTLTSTSVKVRPVGILNSTGKLIMVVEPAAIPVGVVNTKEWLDEVLTRAVEIVSETPVSMAPYTTLVLKDTMRTSVVIFVRIFFCTPRKREENFRILYQYNMRSFHEA
jgi:hypothetical protein